MCCQGQMILMLTFLELLPMASYNCLYTVKQTHIFKKKKERKVFQSSWKGLYKWPFDTNHEADDVAGDAAECAVWSLTHSPTTRSC